MSSPKLLLEVQKVDQNLLTDLRALPFQQKSLSDMVGHSGFLFWSSQHQSNRPTLCL